MEDKLTFIPINWQYFWEEYWRRIKILTFSRNIFSTDVALQKSVRKNFGQNRLTVYWAFPPSKCSWTLNIPWWPPRQLKTSYPSLLHDLSVCVYSFILLIEIQGPKKLSSLKSLKIQNPHRYLSFSLLQPTEMAS